MGSMPDMKHCDGTALFVDRVDYSVDVSPVAVEQVAGVVVFRRNETSGRMFVEA